jgi:hypothetical protein
LKEPTISVSPLTPTDQPKPSSGDKAGVKSVESSGRISALTSHAGGLGSSYDVNLGI